MKKWIRICIFLIACCGAANAVFANTCNPATGQGAAPANYKTFCWFDFTGLTATTAGTTQTFTFTLPDGGKVNLTMGVATGSIGFNAVASPAWNGAAFGVTGYTGIPGKPILYTSTAGLGTITFSNITVTPPSGIGSAAYAIVVSDAESTDGAEYINGITSGGAWTQASYLPATSSTPTVTLSGANFSEAASGGAPAGDPGFATTQPSLITVAVRAGGLQGFAVAVQATSLTLSKTITNQRVAGSDQFVLSVVATASGATLTSTTTTGTGNGPFSASASQSLVYGVTVSEQMAPGSAKALSAYSTLLNCVNANTSSTTPLPSNVAGTTSYALGNLALGDAVTCTFSNTANLATITVSKSNGVSSLAAGSTTSYTVTIANLGPYKADGTVFTDPAVTGLSCTSISCSVALGGAVCPVSGSGPGQMSISNLQGSGVSLSTLPASSTLSFFIGCGVTATGQ